MSPLPFMVAEPFGAPRGARTTSSTRRTRSTTKLFWLVLLALSSGSAVQVKAEATKVHFAQQFPQFKPQTGRRWHFVKLSLEGNETLAVVDDPALVWRKTVFREEDSNLVEVRCPRNWKLQKIQETFETEPNREGKTCGVGFSRGIWIFRHYLFEKIAVFFALTETIRETFSYKMSAEEALQGIQAVLGQLVQSQGNQQWSRYVKTPEAFKPNSRHEELQQWSDWKFSFLHYIRAIDAELGRLLDQVCDNPADDYGFASMDDQTKPFTTRLYGILVSYLRNRPLQLIRHVPDNNGFQAWSLLMKDMEPATRQRSLALLTQLSRVQFASDKTITEQLPAYDNLIREYERVSKSKFPDDAKLASVMLALPPQLRTQIQMNIDENTTFEILVQRIQQYEAVTTRWDASNSLTLPHKTSTLTNDTSGPMEVDAVYEKGKGKGKKGKGKDKGKGKWKGNDKGKGYKGFGKYFKGKQEKGGFKGKHKGSQKGQKGEKGKSENCFNCGKPGHKARDCWAPKRVQQVEEETTTRSSASTSSQSTTAQPTVRRVRLLTPPDASTVQIFDITEGDEEQWLETTGHEDNRVWTVQLLEDFTDDSSRPCTSLRREEPEKDEECFEECEDEKEIWAPRDVSIIALHLQDESEPESETEEFQVNMVSQESDWVDVTFDSGADISVLPFDYFDVGEPIPGKPLVMVDAQGRKIRSGCSTKASLHVEDSTGKIVEIKEQFVIGNVRQPLLCAGKFFRRGWQVKDGSCGLCLSHPDKKTEIPLKMSRNSIQLAAKIQTVSIGEDDAKSLVRNAANPDSKKRGMREENVSMREEFESNLSRGDLRVFVLEGYLSHGLKSIEKSPGWHRLPNGVLAHSDPVSYKFLNPSDMLGKHWKCRLTFMKKDNNSGLWQQIENEDDIYSSGDMKFREICPPSEPQRVITFVSPTPFKQRWSFWEPDSEVPVSPFPQLEEEFGEDVEWSDGEGSGLKLADNEALDAEEPHVIEADDKDEVEIDGVKFSAEMKLTELQEACERYCLPKTGSKRKVLKRLESFRLQLQTKVEAELASKIYLESMRKPVKIKAPKIPTAEEYDEHNLTHIPFQSWCEACLATRSKEDAHKSEPSAHGIPVIQFDFGYTFTKPDGEFDEELATKAGLYKEHPKDQFGTMLVAVASETKAVLCLPILAKGSVNLKMIVEELVRFGLHNSGPDKQLIYQSDNERSCKQLLKAIQQVRAQLGLKTEVRTCGVGQHQSNGMAERAIQSVRRLGNCIRKQCEERARIHVWGTSELYPWCFRHASWLMNRFRVLEPEKMTSYELMYGRKYSGAICMFGESVLYKSSSPYKGDDIFKRGVWAGKSHWSETHVVLTPEGAVEARSIRRVPEQFNSFDVHFARGLPWAYTGLGFLMKHGGARRRQAVPAEEIGDEELSRMTKQIANGMVTPGYFRGEETPGLNFGTVTPKYLAIPQTPVPMLERRDMARGLVRSREEEENRGEAAEAAMVEEETSERPEEKRQRTDEGRQQILDPGESLGSRVKRAVDEIENRAEPTSPTKRERQEAEEIRRVELEIHGNEDEADWWEFIPDELYEEEEKEVKNEGWQGDDENHPPVVDEETMKKLDEKAEDEEIGRLLDIPVMTEITSEEGKSYNMLSTRMVKVWKKRAEKHGWFRRARLVARQFKSSVDFEESMTFAPTAASVIPRLFVFILLNVHPDWQIRVMDVKDAFLMAFQPEGERNAIEYRGRFFRLDRCLPGQRTAAKQWYELLKGVTLSLGGQADAAQPTLFRLKDLLISVHVDDLIMVGSCEASEKYIRHLREVAKWKVEVEGPFYKNGDEFSYLKRKYNFVQDGCVVRADPLHIEKLAETCGIEGKKAKKTPTRQDINEIDTTEALTDIEVTRFRSCVGKLLYLSGERPDAQYGIHELARMMSKPTMASWRHVCHMASYLQGTKDFGLKFSVQKKGKSVMDRRSHEETNEKQKHLLEVITDADYAGCKTTRKSLSCHQIFLDGNLLESKVRSQKSISLSSGEAEFVAIVGGCSEAMFLRNLLKFMLGEFPNVKSRSDSSAARSMCQRQGAGRVRHLDSGMYWIQQRIQSKVLEAAPIPTLVNCADIGTKSLSRARTLGLMHMLNMVDGIDEALGIEEFEALEEKVNMSKAVKKIKNTKAKDVMMAVLMFIGLAKADGNETKVIAVESVTWFESWFGTLVLSLKRVSFHLGLGHGLRHFLHSLLETTSFRWRGAE